ncbi:ribosome maturation factor RimM [Fructobacillus parabroussonetiae]|uniref:Ribosome maturation factor RimM n=1 Tax=Fructobacillus parabroussonetiae TaxID=2713174 RepID=A0ABS5QXC0_9LACO|nr:ribosome maturation factor RimM [Fructobacillus parabroussonetiae]MBS9337597.1 ribosome maturation factor RimM [Fructobacillus parabroussonetiae]
METVNYFKIGTIVNTHGIRGELKVKAITDFAEERFAKGATVYRLVDGKYLPEKIAKARMHKGMWLLTFDGVTNINEVEVYKGQELYVSEADRDELADGEYYYSDIVGCTVKDLEGQAIGRVKEIMETGANDVWVVKRPAGPDALIPVIEDVVKDVNVSEQTIVIDVLEGLLD